MKYASLKIEVFEAKDLEKAFEDWLERIGAGRKKVSISDMNFTLIDIVPCDTKTPAGMDFRIEAFGYEADAFDLFLEEGKNLFRLPDGTLADEFWAYSVQDPSVLFDFDIKLFKSFSRETDISD